MDSEACFTNDGYFTTYYNHDWRQNNPHPVDKLHREWIFGLGLLRVLIGPY